VIQCAAVQQALAQHFAVGIERLLAGRLQAGKFLAFGIMADIVAVAHVKKEPGHS